MMMLLQATPGNIVPTDPASMQLMALTTAQMSSVSRLVSFEGEKVSIVRQLRDATGREADELRSLLNQANGAIAGEKAKIEDLKSRIAEVKGDAPKLAEVSAPPLPPDFFLRQKQVFGMSKDEFLGLFVLLITLPIVAAVTRRLWRVGPRKAAATPLALPDDRLQRLEQMVESVAIEVERIGESQRFQSKLMAEKRPEPKRVNTPH